MKNFNLLKTLLITCSLTSLLAGCSNDSYPQYIEGEMVTARCIYNGYYEDVDFSKSVTFTDEKLGEITLTGNGNRYKIGSFEVYDSLYLADINGDGYNDLCTDYMIKLEFSQYWVHTYAFYDYHHETYIFKGKPDQYLS